MCRVLRIVIVAPPDRHLELRRSLNALDYEIIGVFGAVDAVDVEADVAVAMDPDARAVTVLRARGLKVVSVGGADGDLTLTQDDLRAFKTRVWELFRP